MSRLSHLFRLKATLTNKLRIISAAIIRHAFFISICCAASSAFASSLASPVPDTGRMLLNKCKIDEKEKGNFWTGVCLGYIYSKIDRIDVEQGRLINEKRNHYNKVHGDEKYDLPTVIFRALQEKDIYQKTKYKINKINISSDDILDYIIQDVIYK